MQNGGLDKCMSCVVAQSFDKKSGFDFLKTISSVIKPVTIKVIITLVLSKGWKLHQLSINNAFLNGLINEKVYMTQPSIFENPLFPWYVYKLNKAIYSLRQVSGAWFDTLSNAFCSMGFVKSLVDPLLFCNFSKASPIYLFIHVDDIIIPGWDKSDIKDLVSTLNAIFSLKYMGLLHYFFGIEITKLENGDVLITQKYTLMIWFIELKWSFLNL